MDEKCKLESSGQMSILLFENWPNAAISDFSARTTQPPSRDTGADRFVPNMIPDLFPGTSLIPLAFPSAFPHVWAGAQAVSPDTAPSRGSKGAPLRAL